jgi:molybdopterin-synthase adenylyltransferase
MSSLARREDTVARECLTPLPGTERVAISRFAKLKIPGHYYVWCSPPDSSGEESLHFVSHRRTIKLKGHAFREFERRVVPLLDGEQTLEEIGRQVEDVFPMRDLETGLELLESQGLLENVDGNLPQGPDRTRFVPQQSFFYEMGLNPAKVLERLQRATVTVFGMSGAGPMLSECLSNMGVGRVRLVDSLSVCPADLYLSSAFDASDLGSGRAATLKRRFSTRFPESTFETEDAELNSDEAVSAVVKGSDYVASCLDSGQSSLLYKLNRVCLENAIDWTSCSLAGTEVIIGPTVYPRRTACYLCYKMRFVACAGNPEDSFAFEELLDGRKKDDSGRRENLAIGANLAANFLALEMIRDLAGLSPPTTAGKVVIFNLLDLSTAKHVVLRKPWCPACFTSQAHPHSGPSVAPFPPR